MTDGDLYVVVPAGGSGTRLWPLSRMANPKFLHPFTGTERSLLQATFDRLAPLSTAGRLLVVTGTSHATDVARQLPELPDDNILVEPFARDSCAAIGLAAAVIHERAPGAIMASFAADHLIRDQPAFHRTVREAMAGASDGRLMTIGITPTRPETGYGYVECSQQIEQSVIQEVLRFKEKPPLELATEFVQSKRYLWNASIFVWRTDVFLDALKSYRPDIAEPLITIARAWDTPRRDEVLAELWPTVPRIAVEYAVMEPAAADSLVSTVPGDFGWSDIGDFETLASLFGHDNDGCRVIETTPDSNTFASIDSDGLIVVPGSGRLIAALDAHDMIIVDSPDAVLICNKRRSQDIKKLTQLLRDRGHHAFI